MKNRVTAIFSVIIVFALALSCTPFSNTAGTTNGEYSGIELAIPVAQPGSKVATTFTTGDYAWVRAFDSDRNRVAIGGSGVYSVTLNWDSGNSRWAGSMDLSSVSGEITFLAIVFNSSNQVVYRGLDTRTISSGNPPASITLTAAESFSIGDVGPAGGKIYYDKTSYSDSWRYLEAAPSDVSESWAAYDLDSGYTLDGSGNVYSGVTLIASIYDWYWGPNDNPVGTDVYISYGSPNTSTLTTLDGTSSATPNIKKLVPRPFSASAIGRRKISTTVSNLVQNGCDDWFTPSKVELETMYTNIKATGNFSANKYWSSSESTTVYETVSSKNVYSSHYIDFAQSSLTSATTGRYFLYRVRPSRRF